MSDFTPKDPTLSRIWERLSEETKEKRLAQAQHRSEVVKKFTKRSHSTTERKAASRLKEDRSSIRRWSKKSEEAGLEGLVDRRVARESQMTPEIRTAICTYRRADPRYPVEEIVRQIKEHHQFETSATVVKRVLKEAGLNHPPGSPKGVKPVSSAKLELGGMKLVEAADVETGYSLALVHGVMDCVEAIPTPETARPAEQECRDSYGRFLPEYNERYRKKEGDAIGPGFASVSEKREGMDPGRLQIRQVSEDVMARKIVALQVSHLLGGGRWDGIRVSRGELLEELCGHAYMPSTLDRFTRELKYVGVSSTLWEIHARLWLKCTGAWGEPLRAVILYVDATTKPIWTKLFSQSTKISQVGRVMPGLEVVSFHSGYGVPLMQLTHSGRAPLVRVVPGALASLDELYGSSAVGRIIVIDAEGNSVPFLKGLEQGEPSRGWVTRLRPDWLEGKRIFNRTNYRPYREGDRVRMGVADFNDPETGGQFRMRVVEVERRTTAKVTYLGASLMLEEREWNPQRMADLYFDRWPEQEANFRSVNQAVGSKEVHGYGKRLVDNVSVLTELDDLQGWIRGLEESIERQQQQAEDVAKETHQTETKVGRLEGRLETVKRHVEAEVEPGKMVTRTTQELVRKQTALTDEIQQQTKELAVQRTKQEKVEAVLEQTRKKQAKNRARREVLEKRRTIFAHDVELDSLFGLMKVGLVLLVTYVMKEYLGDCRMEAMTFLERVATLPARLRVTPELEIVSFEYNRRDPDVMGLLRTHCEAINARGLRLRSGRKLRMEIDPEPPRSRPAPPGSRVGSGDRFAR